MRSCFSDNNGVFARNYYIEIEKNGIWEKVETSDPRVELSKEDYKWKRKKEYPDMGVQLDYIYHNGVDKWKTDIVDPVKAKYPKPE